MKKVMVAAAGLMLVGAMATTAMAEFKFSGDARTRFYYQNEFDFRDANGNTLEDADGNRIGNWTASNDDTHWNSRVRFKIDADTKGGAYARTRFYVGSHTWGTTSNGSAALSTATDYAYIGVPMGPVTVEGGRVIRNITPWLFYDGRADAIQAFYKNAETTVLAFYDTVDEDTSSIDDNDVNRYGALLLQGFSGGWNLTVGGFYMDDEVNDSSSNDYNDGFTGTVKVDGAIDKIALTAEMSYADKDTQNSAGFPKRGDDDGWGGYLSATAPIGPVELLGMVGFTTDGFAMDAADFGPFILLNDYSQISTGLNFAEFGDSFFAVLAPTYKVSEKLTVGAQASLADVDNDYGDDFTAWEIGATASYMVVDGASLNGIIGYLDSDDMLDHDPWGLGLSLEISF